MTVTIEGVSELAEDYEIATVEDELGAKLGLIMIIIPQLFVIVVAAVDANEVTVLYPALRLKMSDCLVLACRSDVPATVPEVAEVEERRGLVLVEKSLQS